MLNLALNPVLASVSRADPADNGSAPAGVEALKQAEFFLFLANSSLSDEELTTPLDLEGLALESDSNAANSRSYEESPAYEERPSNEKLPLEEHR